MHGVAVFGMMQLGGTVVNLILNLPPETEARLLQIATQSGKGPEALALEALDEKLAGSVDPQHNRTREAWLAEFRAWVASHPASKAATLDDSRESIYEGSGE
jgi:predicted transcriptional regulator